MRTWNKHGWFFQGVALVALLAYSFSSEPEAVSGPAPDYRAVLALFREVNAWAAGSPTGCPTKEVKVETAWPSACFKDGKMDPKCESCAEANNKQKEKMQKRKAHQAACNAVSCNPSSAGADRGAAPAMGAGAAAARTGRGCFAQRGREISAMRALSEGCVNDIKKACEGVTGPVADQAKKTQEDCEKAAKEDKATEKENKDKEKDAKKQEDKNKDNQKKEGSGGDGKMPQMQPPQQQQEEPEKQQQTDPTTNSQPQVTQETKPEVETSKFTDAIKNNSVGFGVGSNTETSTIAPPPGGFASGFASHENDENRFGENKFGGNGPGNTGNIGSVGGGGAGGGSSGSLSLTGASSPGDHKGDSANPYEVSPGGGGKLGAPKGFKGGTEGDAAVAEATAKSDFKNEFGDKPGAANPEQAAPEPEEEGYTIFKMVKYRYVELKKRGSI